MNIWVIGNGESRRNFALNQINDVTIGCNAVHRDHSCTEFVAVDRRMVSEILKNDAVSSRIIYTRPDWAKEYSSNRIRRLPDIPFTGPSKADIPFHWNSGPYAVLLACLYEPTEIHLLGFDLYSKDSLVNNIYKDTANYSVKKSKPVAPDFWIYQLAKLFKHFEKIKFVQHQIVNWTMPHEWSSIKNLTIKYDIV